MLVVFSVAVFIRKRFEPFFRAETVIRPAEFDKLFGVFMINFLPFALNVRSVISADVRSFVVNKPRTLKRTVNKLYRAFNVALLIGILYS